jgi:formyltetrahydrofolate synthetase
MPTSLEIVQAARLRPIPDVAAAGAGFVTAVTGDVQLMPGLPARPAAEEIDIDAEGRVVGLR